MSQDNNIYTIKEFKRSVEDETQWVAILKEHVHGIPITDEQRLHRLEVDDKVRLIDRQTIQKIQTH